MTGKAIAECYQDTALVRKFRESSKDNRGIICSVEYPVEAPVTLRAGLQIAFRFPSAVVP